ncbi:MAG: hypothetical protein GF344_00600, partial [Chitinivibrionales bacterium]|nr:hypothetical protein [Chitinivibrionales bacterium]
MKSTKRSAGALLVLLMLANKAVACTLPVFAYALERWEPDAYAVMVFYEDSLSQAEEKAVDSIMAHTYRGGNFEVHLVDVADSMMQWEEFVWEQQTAHELPWLVVRYPRGSYVNADLWTSRLEDFPIERFANSPMRREIARRILDGHSAVWVLLMSGDKAADRNASKKLRAALKEMEKKIELPEVAPQDLPIWYNSENGPKLRIYFSVVHLSAGDPAEQLFVRMLRNSLPESKERQGPIAFPVMGQGRALPALVEEQMTPEMIERACRFLSGPCSCVIKEDNPGFDLMMAVKWWDELRIADTASAPAPTLMGFMDMVEEKGTAESTKDSASRVESKEAAKLSVVEEKKVSKAPSKIAQSTKPTPTVESREAESKTSEPESRRNKDSLLVDRSPTASAKSSSSSVSCAVYPS